MKKQIQKLPLSFYQREDVVHIARELLGKIVVTNINGRKTSGRIVETEAYMALVDRASHSFGGRRTRRNEHMYAPAGTAYVYICYGIHQMLNVVTNARDIPDAILIRAIEPMVGVDIMMHRTGKTLLDHTLTRGPGNVAKALGVFAHHSGAHLLDSDIYLLDDGYQIYEDQLGISKRVGVEGAGEDAAQPYRFYVKDNPFVSGRPR